ncbi:MAG: PEGA domain-containing protein [Bradymonadaceae bacterium]
MGVAGRAKSWMCVLLVGLLLGPAVGSAETPKSGEDIDEQTAKEVLQLLREGKKAYGNEEFEKAYEVFQKAYDKWPRPAILVRLGRTAEELGRKKEALKHYRSFLQEKPEADLADKIDKRVSELAAKLPATVHLTSKPSGAKVFKGKSTDEKVGETPVELEVDPGKYTWSIRLEGYRNTARTVEVSGGQHRKLNVELEALGSQPELVGNKETEADSPSPKKTETNTGSPLGAWGWGTSAVGLAGIGTGVVFTMLQGRAVKQANTYNRGASGATRRELASLKSQARMHHRVALIAYSAGGALLATGTGLLLTHGLGSGTGKQSSARIGPRFGFDANGGWAGFHLDF